MLLKDTSQASIITVAELSFQGKLIASSTFKNTEVYTLVALMYLVMCVPLILIVGRLERRSERKMIPIRDVSKSFGTNLVLDGITLEVTQGEVVCVIGASGSGKSTLLRCVNGLESYDSGEIVVDGQRVDRDARHIVAIREKVAMVFQRFNLFPHRTALENVIEGPVYVKGEPRAPAIERAGRCSFASASPARRTNIRIASRAASSSASRSRARWRCSRRRSCSTSRRRRSTRSSSARCWR